MKFTTVRENLLRPLQLVSNVVERRLTTPILANTLIRVRDQQILLVGTDLEMEMRATAEVSHSENGDITLPARKLLDLCKSLPEAASIDVSIDRDKAVVKSGRSRFSLTTMPAVEFPEIESVDNTDSFTIQQADLKFLLEQTQFAMAQQDVRYYLNGMLLSLQKEKITAVATDGHRLACTTRTVPCNLVQARQIIVPRKGVTEVLRLMDSASTAEAKLQISNNYLRVVLPQITFTTKLIDGKFPDYEQVLPKNPTKQMQADRIALHQCFTRIAVLSNEKFRSMRLHLQTNLLRASVHNPEQEVAEEELEVHYQGEEIEIGFNISYFLDVLAAIKAQRIDVFFTDSSHSCLIHGTGDEDCRYVIMPMRL